MSQRIEWSDLGDHVHFTVFSHLSFSRARRLSSVSKRWRKFFLEHQCHWRKRWLLLKADTETAENNDDEHKSSSDAGTGGGLVGLFSSLVSSVTGAPDAMQAAAAGGLLPDSSSEESEDDDEEEEEEEVVEEDGSKDGKRRHSSLDRLLKKRVCHVAVVYKDFLFIHGGHIPKKTTPKFIGKVRRDIICFSLKDRRRVPLPSLGNNSPRLTEHSAVVWRNPETGSVGWYLFGGFTGRVYSSDVYRFDFELGTFERLSTTPKLFHHDDIHAYPFGPENEEQVPLIREVIGERLPSFSRVEWPAEKEQTEADVFQARRPLEVSAHAAVVANDHMYIFGGWNGRANNAALHRLNLRTLCWQAVSLEAPAPGHLSVIPPALRSHCAVTIELPSVLNPLYQSFELTASHALIASSNDGNEELEKRSIVAEEAAAAAAPVAGSGQLRMWVLCGYAGLEGHRAGILEYCFESNCWRELTTRHQGRVGLNLGPSGRSRSAVTVFTRAEHGAMRDQLLVLGGWDRKSLFGDLWSLDVISRIWKRLPARLNVKKKKESNADEKDATMDADDVDGDGVEDAAQANEKSKMKLKKRKRRKRRKEAEESTIASSSKEKADPNGESDNDSSEEEDNDEEDEEAGIGQHRLNIWNGWLLASCGFLTTIANCSNSILVHRLLSEQCPCDE